MTRGTVKRRQVLPGCGGFTIVELMVVVGLIGILAAIALLSFAGYRQRAHDARAMHDLGNAITAEEACFVTKGEYVAVSEVVGPSRVGTPEFVVSDRVRLSVAAEKDSFTVRATALLGTGLTFEYDSTTGVITQY
jgi:type IV pilus assembly protein PilA